MIENESNKKKSKFKNLIEKEKESLKKARKPLIITILAFVLLALLIIGYANIRIDKISKMSYDEMLVFAAKNVNTRITVGIVQNGEMSYKVYGKNAEELPQIEHVYEIASITKTFTTALLFKAIEEGKASLDDSIDKYIDLPGKEYYPTLKRLVTHTAGYATEYSGNSKEQLLNLIGKTNLKNMDYAFNYSNYGFEVIGLVLEGIYGEDYTKLINDYLSNELGLANTKVNDGTGDLGRYSLEKEDSGKKPSGALASTITDMMNYAILQLEGTPAYLAEMHNPITDVTAGRRQSQKLNTRIDSMGASWLIDTDNGIIWHDGAMSNYNSYIGFDKERQIAVVVLINAMPDILIPSSLHASIIGAKLLTDLQK